MFKVKNKNTTTTSFCVSIVKFAQHFTPFSGVSIVDFEQVNVIWENSTRTTKIKILKQAS